MHACVRSGPLPRCRRQRQASLDAGDQLVLSTETSRKNRRESAPVRGSEPDCVAVPWGHVGHSLLVIMLREETKGKKLDFHRSPLYPFFLSSVRGETMGEGEKGWEKKRTHKITKTSYRVWLPGWPGPFGMDQAVPRLRADLLSPPLCSTQAV